MRGLTVESVEPNPTSAQPEPEIGGGATDVADANAAPPAEITELSQLDSPPVAPSRNSGNELAAVTLPPQPVPLTSGQPNVHGSPSELRPKKSLNRKPVVVGAAALGVLVAIIGYRLYTGNPTPTTVALGAAVHIDSRPPVTSVSAATPPPEAAAGAVTAINANANAKDPSEHESPAASATLPVPPRQQEDTRGEEDTIPTYVSKPALLHLSALATRRAERCHPHGHAVGTARVLVTFAQTGRVSGATIEGEPIASAPVASCILGHVHSIRIPKFDGAPFTHTLPITMR